MPLLAIDLGYAGAGIVLRESMNGPEVVYCWAWAKWDDAKMAEQLRYVLQGWKPRAVCYERPLFIPSRAKIGASQHHKAGFVKGLAALVGIPAVEVPRQGPQEAALAAKLLRRSLDEQGVKMTEHVRDCAAIALCALGRAREGKEKV